MLNTGEHFEAPHLEGGEIDTHFHSVKLHDRGMDLSAVLRASFDAGLCACIDIGLSEDDVCGRHSSLCGFDRIWFAHGLYPSNAERPLPELLDAIESLRPSYRHRKVCAVGEIGIDRHWDWATPAAQKELFALQIERANEEKLPIIVHNREAESEILDVLRSSTRPFRESVMHCYSGPPERIAEFLDLGFSVSFGGNATFKNAHAVRDALSRVPVDRLLLETDAPFLAPHPKRGKGNHPGLVGYTYDVASAHLGVKRGDLIEAIKGNVERIFGIPRVFRNPSQSE